MKITEVKRGLVWLGAILVTAVLGGVIKSIAYSIGQPGLAVVGWIGLGVLLGVLYGIFPWSKPAAALLWIGLFAAAVPQAQAVQRCENRYDPMNGKWVLVCWETQEEQRPNCRNVYDPMNGKWVYVCT